MLKKTALFLRDGFPNKPECLHREETMDLTNLVSFFSIWDEIGNLDELVERVEFIPDYFR